MRVDIPLLRWYDANARALPWRSPPLSPPPDPYRVWLSEIMLQQTTVAAVKPYFAAFTARWPTVAALAAADDGEVMRAWAGLGYYARARNLLACARAVGDIFPDDERALRALPGIGRYTAAAIASIAFGKRAVVVDGNVERVVARLFAVETPLPAARGALYALADTITPDERAGDFAQAMMDLGSTVCTARAPRCTICPLVKLCSARSDAFPRRLAKVAKPERSATALWTEKDGRVLLVRRPAKGLLGGMLALPSTLGPPPNAPVGIDGELIGTITHVFTHFRLTMEVRKSSCALQPGGEWWPVARIAEAGLPTVFAKAAQIATGRITNV